MKDNEIIKALECLIGREVRCENVRKGRIEMNMTEFEKVTIERINECINVLNAKSKQYSTDLDKLHNFKVAAELQGRTSVKALAGMMAKHTVSIYDPVNSVENGENIPLEMWDEKIGDHINYLLLLNALVREKEKERTAVFGE